MASNAAGKRPADTASTTGGSAAPKRQKETEGLKLQWAEYVDEYNLPGKKAYDVSHKGLTATFNRGIGAPHGPVLPTTGRWSFKMRIDSTSNNSFQLGVATAGGTCGFMFNPPGGNLFVFGDPPAGTSYKRGEHIQVFEKGTDVWIGAHTSAGHVVKAVSKALGTVVEFSLDNTSGALSIGINGGPLREALAGFPPGMQLCPYWCGSCKGDRVSFVKAILDVEPSPGLWPSPEARLAAPAPADPASLQTFTLAHPGVTISEEGRVAKLMRDWSTALCGAPMSSGTHSVTLRISNSASLGMAPSSTALATAKPAEPRATNASSDDDSPIYAPKTFCALHIGLGSNGYLKTDGKHSGPFGEWGVALCESRVRMEYDASERTLRWFKGDEMLAEAKDVPNGWYFGVSDNFGSDAEIVG
jgi:hypothetical protein